MAVSLYTSRVVLEVLGVEDFGVYNVVGGIVGMFAFLNSTMSSSTSRFITFTLGEEDKEKLNSTFNAALIIHICIALLVIVIIESIGLWFLYNKLVIPEARMNAAFWVLQLSVITSFFSITQVPYNACIIAHEKIDLYAYIEIFHVLLKLIVVYVLIIGEIDKLILYAILNLLVSVFIMFVYRIYCIRHFEESHFQLKTDKQIYKSMLTFSGWDLLGHFGYTFRYQGCNMVLNMFFGAIVNAAVGITSTVQGILLQFSNNITMAVKPQIIKRYSVGNVSSMLNLVYSSIRLNLFMILLITIPIVIEIPYLLSLWLVDVPEYCAVFCQMALCANVLSSYSQVVYIAIQATGDLKQTSINRNIIYVSTPIVLYALYLWGFQIPTITYVLLLLGQFIQSILDVNILKKKFPQLYISKLFFDFLKIFIIIILTSVLCHIVCFNISSGIYRLICVFVLSSSLLIILFTAFIFSLQERLYVKDLLLRFYERIHN
ncbi:MAG: polysaccharide biosynthesis protein [Bacteroidaceae bacterium]|nr:polysaccharide biosynthesis protein [Bacteroidaceae bacterium]